MSRAPQAACPSFQREERLFTLDVLQRVAAERRQGLAVGLSEGGGDYDGAPERLAHALDARRSVGRRTDHRELEARRHADVAVGDRPQVQADAVADRYTLRVVSVVGRDALPGEPRRGQGALARLARRRADGKNGKRRVAHVAKYLALVLHDRARDAIEIAIEVFEILLACHRLRERSRVAQITEPDHGLDLLAIAVLYETVEHARAGTPAEERLEQRHRGAPLREHFQQAAEYRQHFVHRAKLCGAKPVLGEGGH